MSPIGERNDGVNRRRPGLGGVSVVPVGLVGPFVAILLAAALGCLVVHRYTGERADVVTRVRAEQAAGWLYRRGPSGVAELRSAHGVRWAGLLNAVPPSLQDGGQGETYSFLRKPVWTSHTDAAHDGKPLLREDEADKAAADFLALSGSSRLPDGGWRAGIGEARPAGVREGAVVEMAPTPRVPLPWAGLGVAVLAALVLAFDLLRRDPASHKRPLVVAGLTATGLLGILGPRLSAVDALEVPASRDSADALGAGMLLCAVVLVPLVVYAVVGAVRGSRPSTHRLAYTYIGPAILGLGVLVLVPFLYGVGLAFTRSNGGAATFIGLDNFVSILSCAGRKITEPLSFYFTLVVTLLWTAANVFFHVGIGLGLALLLKDATLRFKAVYRVLLIIPWAVPSYITALIWKGMFNQQYGLVNHVLGALGIEGVAWFSGFWTAFTANVVTNTWLGFPFMMVVSLGALQSIPGDLYEAASVDGASRYQQFRHITLPLLRPALVPAVILGSVWTFNMFNVIYLVSGGQPSHSTDILITQAYRWAFEQDRYGYAAAYSVLIFLILLVWSGLTQRWTKASEADA